ncbi:MAG: glycosyltransferase, partial [Streptosporangiaceae bacterium]
EAVLETTLSHLVSSDHPAFEVLVVVGADDPGTREVAERVAGRHPEQVSVVIDASWPKNKPKALNAALPHCTGVITGVFDAEDAVHPDLLRRADQCFQENDADIVQAGVQLMNFRSRWWTVHNVLEYYFWFRSRLNRHARQRFIPLGGNTVFIRTQVLRAVAGWDPDCLAEDCELGVRLSSLGARTVVFYEPELVTREECPPTLRAFIRQRTRWNQGYLQTLSKGHWRNLAPPQRAIGAYILGMPFVMAVAWLLIPAAIVTAVALKAPVPITLISFLPLLPLLAMLVAEIAGLGEFCRVYGERASLRDYGRLALGLPLYQVLLTLAAARAVTRHVRGTRDWEKTTHLGQHLGQSSPTTRALAPSPAGARTAVAASAGAKTGGPAADSALDAPADTSLGEPPAAAATPGPRARPGLSAPWDAGLRAAADGNGDWHARHTHELRAAGSGEPLWARLDGAPVRGKSRPSRPKRQPVSLRAGVRWLGDVRTRLGDVVRLRPWVLLPLALIAVVAAVVGPNLLHWPATQFDEGTYVGDAWAVQSGRLAPYTYSYGHPPLAWLLIALWTSMAQIFGNVSYSVDAGREFMLLVDLVSCGLLYALARRLGFGRVAASASVLIFGLCPLALFFHRAVLLDNPSITFTIAAFLLAWTPQRRLWAFAASGACFAAGVLCKETTIVLLPALLVAVAQNADRQTRRYCLALFVSAFVLIAGFYPLYATLKGELLPGPGHVSLVGYLVVQLFTRKGTGSLFDPHSQTHAIVAAWLKLDPWLLGLALVLLPVALARRTTRAIAIAFLIRVVTVLRPGYLPNMYVIGLLPFAALMVPGGIEALWRAAQGMTSRVPFWSGRAAVAGLAIAAMAVVAPHWVQGDQVATTVRLDGPQRAAEHWLLAHVSHRERLIVGDQYWIYLIAHGYDHHPMRG